MHLLRLAKLIFATSFLFLLAQPALSGCAQLPSAFPDQAEALIQPILIDVLANDSEPSSMALTIEVLGENCPGTVAVNFGLLELTPSTFLLADCTIDYRVRNEEGEVSTATTVTVRNIPTLIFEDGLESGDASAWPDCGPSCP